VVAIGTAATVTVGGVVSDGDAGLTADS